MKFDELFRSFLPDTFTRVLIAKYVTILQYIDSYFQNEGGVFLSPYLKKTVINRF